MVLRSCVRWFSLWQGVVAQPALWLFDSSGSDGSRITNRRGRQNTAGDICPSSDGLSCRTARLPPLPVGSKGQWPARFPFPNLQATRAVDSPWQSETNAHASCTVGGIGGGDGTTPWCAETSWATRAGVRPATGPVTSHNRLPDACLPGPYLGMVGWLPVLRDAIAVSGSN